ncbi:MAG: hypothetical protein BTN85_1235 [Candidatus Methanohalarchaeum thermophilum]|uniref:Uncharacterized protein n=1 Tax=Methanohalarchaeum thermophilum TaxID=1903181 RepID=A0A1Q6DWL0_METT1|nr:MAG: hypothetical protein BTN85_1235 [Candidatus Methanohalarchaeum thermophilum]
MEGFSHHDNYLNLMRQRIVSIINPRSGLEEKVKEKLEKASVNIKWFDSQNSKQFEELLKEFEESSGWKLSKNPKLRRFQTEEIKDKAYIQSS